MIYDNITEAMPFHRIFVDKETGEVSPPKTRLLTEAEALANAEKMNMVSFKRRLQHLKQKGLDAEAHHYEKGYTWSLRHTYENETTWTFNYKLMLKDATINPPFKDISIDKRTGAIPL